jgi:allantoicase
MIVRELTRPRERRRLTTWKCLHRQICEGMQTAGAGLRRKQQKQALAGAEIDTHHFAGDAGAAVAVDPVLEHAGVTDAATADVGLQRKTVRNVSLAK